VGDSLSFINLNKIQGLSYIAIGDIHQNEPLIFLHGIMGSKKNLTTFAHMLIEKCPQSSGLIFDLRNHGLSSKHWQPYTVAACADDISMACEMLAVCPKKIIGHSFGGKVALIAATLINTIEQVWLLDCSLGVIAKNKPLHKTASLTVLEIIEVLLSLNWPITTRKSLVEQLIERRVSRTVAAWMTTNVIAHDDGLYLLFEPREIKKMLLDFMKLDCWPLVASLGNTMKIHVVAAEHGQRLSKKDKEKLQKLVPEGHGFFHVLKDAGHFLHSDNPLGLIEIMSPFLA
jgi:esterase